MTYRIDPTAPPGHRVRDLRYRGRPVDPHASFTLVCNDYRAAGGGGFPHLADAPVVWRSSEEMTDLIGDFLAGHDPWTPAADENWTIAPAIAGERPLSSPVGVGKVTQ
jgi:5''-nucleotidase, C-terminal domain.